MPAYPPAISKERLRATTIVIFGELAYTSLITSIENKLPNTLLLYTLTQKHFFLYSASVVSITGCGDTDEQ